MTTTIEMEKIIKDLLPTSLTPAPAGHCWKYSVDSFMGELFQIFK